MSTFVMLLCLSNCVATAAQLPMDFPLSGVTLVRVEEHRSRIAYFPNESSGPRHVLALVLKVIDYPEGVEELRIGTSAAMGEKSGQAPGAATWVTSSGSHPVRYHIVAEGDEVEVYVPVSQDAEQAIPDTGEGLVIVRRELEGGGGYLFEECRYRARKFLCDDASIDSRRDYNQATAGNAPFDLSVNPEADPNMAPRNLNFGEYTYRGGLFAGHMDFLATNDRSGTARIQLRPRIQGEWWDAEPRYAAAALFYMGTDESADGPMELGHKTLQPEAPDYGISELEMTWDNRWFQTPSSTTASMVFGAGAGTVSEYRSIQFGHITDAPTFAVSIMLTDEEDFAAAGLSGWRYFASEEYQLALSEHGFPYDDCAPRYWFILKVFQ